MRLHRVFVSELKPEVWLSPSESHHLKQVLRVKLGQKLIVFNGKGLEAEAEVSELEGLKLALCLGEIKASDVESAWRLILALSLLKGDKFADVIRQGTELGVVGFIPVLSQYCDVREFKEGRLERYKRIAQEASKQCGRSLIPDIYPLHQLADLIHLPADLKLVAHPYSHLTLSESLAGYEVDKTLDILCLTGPEGGFSPKDLENLKLESSEIHSFKAIQLGKRILRAETAPIALASAILLPQGL
ncbi:MAG: RsmE family RNA methyltransferase [Deinococcales bacterium]